MKTTTLLLVLFFSLLSTGLASDMNITEQKRLFLNPPEDCRIMMRWWWFGPVDRPRKPIRIKYN